MKPYNFYRSLHARGQTLDKLAAVLQTKPGHLSMVFRNQRGANTRKHIVPHLTPAELTMLGWTTTGDLAAGHSADGPTVPREQVHRCEDVSRGTSSQV